MPKPLPVGKLPAELLTQLLAQAPVNDPRVVLRPGIGLDCAVIDLGSTQLVFKTDPITFATDEIGWYLVQVNANDIATTGASPRWFMVSLLLPEANTTPGLARQIMAQVYQACEQLGVSVIGGHTEITFGLSRPIAVGTMIGEVAPGQLVTPRGAEPGDRLLLTKGVPIEGTAILAREFAGRLGTTLSADDLAQARAFLTHPGISVVRDARLARQAGRVTAMHDPTEGGLATALWELAEASDRSLVIDPAAIPIPPLSAVICQAMNLDPLATLSSGALLLTAPPPDAQRIRQSLAEAGLPCAEIGEVESGPAAVWQTAGADRSAMSRPARDEIARVYES